ncbi:MAG: DUF2493 domain-containing protein [Mesorhizobium sp.]|uniref:SLOG family protein n=1 Tax=Mesorhizobium sp. TaxID=1871066 RepID=UPI000FE45CB1|nr:SLOG family protein [Mesorhizobium sp.]RWO57146.1 MAG: DUF2493 domain-containing protein [Mesorhizobium sp.]TIN41374.1 MAG: DUF2493 domain-containing protein [Mesorhizobium sp.]TJU86152.1 MAG: DUF2493 domain-containing protein [Mesorhizobium sp.]
MARELRVLVCGGRDFSDGMKMHFALQDLWDERGPFAVIIHGNARGADAEAKEWALEKGIKHAPFIAAWEDLTAPGAVIRYIKATGKPYNANAGPQRNQRMIDDGKPDIVVAFPGGKGTRDMIDRARRAGLEVIEV